MHKRKPDPRFFFKENRPDSHSLTSSQESLSKRMKADRPGDSLR